MVHYYSYDYNDFVRKHSLIHKWRPQQRARLETVAGGEALKAATDALEEYRVVRERAHNTSIDFEVSADMLRAVQTAVERRAAQVADAAATAGEVAGSEAMAEMDARNLKKYEAALNEAAHDEATQQQAVAVTAAANAIAKVEEILKTEAPPTATTDPLAQASAGGGAAGVITVTSVLRVRHMVIDLESKPSHAAYLLVKPAFSWLCAATLGVHLASRVTEAMGWTEAGDATNREAAEAAKAEASRISEEKTAARAARKTASRGASAEQLKMRRLDDMFGATPR